MGSFLQSGCPFLHFVVSRKNERLDCPRRGLAPTIPFHAKDTGRPTRANQGDGYVWSVLHVTGSNHCRTFDNTTVEDYISMKRKSEHRGGPKAATSENTFLAES